MPAVRRFEPAAAGEPERERGSLSAMSSVLPSATVLIVFLAACGDDGGAADADATGTTDTTTSDVPDTIDATDATTPDGCGAPGGAGPRFDQPPSLFRLHVHETFSYFEGGVFTADPMVLHGEAERQGACRLLTYTPSLCTPECDFTEVCVAGQCRTFPEATPVGDLTLTGVAASLVTVRPSEVGSYSWSSVVAHAVDEVALVAAGGDVGAFTLATCAPPALVEDGDWNAAFEARADGADVTIRWRDPTPGARFYIRMTTGIGTHGGISPVEVECEGPDDGALTIPGAFLDALYATGWSCGECGDNRLVRYHADEVEVGGERVQLRVQSTATFWYRP